MTQPLTLAKIDNIRGRSWWNCGLMPPSGTTGQNGFIEMFYAVQSEAQTTRDRSLRAGESLESASMPIQVGDAIKFAKNRGAKSCVFIDFENEPYHFPIE